MANWQLSDGNILSSNQTGYTSNGITIRYYLIDELEKLYPNYKRYKGYQNVGQESDFIIYLNDGSEILAKYIPQKHFELDLDLESKDGFNYAIWFNKLYRSKIYLKICILLDSKFTCFWEKENVICAAKLIDLVDKVTSNDSYNLIEYVNKEVYRWHKEIVNINRELKQKGFNDEYRNNYLFEIIIDYYSKVIF